MAAPSVPTTRRRLGVAGAALTALVAPVALALPASASTTAQEIVYTADDDNDGIYSVVVRDLGSGRVTPVLPANTDEQWIYDDPELSPNGDRILLSTDRGSTEFDEGIAVVDRDGTGFRRLTSPPSTESVFAIDVAGAWSPDGSTILFTRITTDATDQADIEATTALYTVPAAGGTATAVANAGDGYTADWSPDGRRIVFAALPDSVDPDGDGPEQAPEVDSGPITVMNVDGTGRRPLGNAVGLMPAWSPDGSTIAYATITERDPDRARAEDATHIATVPVAGGDATVLPATRPSDAKTVAEYPAWSSDGESIFYDMFGYSTTDSFPPGDVWAVDEDGVRAGRVTETAGDEAQAHVQGPKPAPVSAGTASTYTPVTPARILDTRAGTGVPAAGKVGAAGTVDLMVRGDLRTRDGGTVSVPANASAVVLNLTVAGASASTDVRAYPSGSSIPEVSSLNTQLGRTVPNLATVRIGANGAITVRNAAGDAHLIGDIAGYYTPDEVGNGFAALDPRRVLDTRPGDGNVGPSAQPIGSGGVLDLRVTGEVPVSGGSTVSVPEDARAVVLNVTAIAPTTVTDVRVYPTPAGDEYPGVSNLNVERGQAAANLVTVAVSDAGTVRIRNAEGSVHVAADIAGYYSADAGGRFVPVTPLRFLDTRSGTGAAAIPTTRQAYLDLRVGGTRGIPAEASAVVLNLTATSVATTTDLRVYPATAATLPRVSNLNVSRGMTRANSAIVRTGDNGEIRIRNAELQVDLIGDVAGYMVG